MKPSPLLALLAMLVAILSGCARAGEAAAANSDQAPIGVRTSTARIVFLPVTVEVIGSVRSVQRATLAPKIMGAIADFPITLGQTVKAGDLLVTISAGEIAARVTQAQAQLNVVRRDLERERDLLTKGASTAEMVHNLEDQYAMSAARVHEAEVMLGNAQIRAPFDGVVTAKNADAGDLASPGHALLELDGLGAFEVAAGIPDSLAGRLAVGAPLAVIAPATGATFAGRLTELSAAADPTARTVAARIALPAGAAVRSGEFVRVQVPGEAARTMLVPAEAISVLGQMERLFVIGPGHRAELRLVKTGAVHGDQVEILSGLDNGEVVVLAPPAGLHEGRALEFRP